MKKKINSIMAKTACMLKRAYNAYLDNFMNLYGPTIKSGISPFI